MPRESKRDLALRVAFEFRRLSQLCFTEARDVAFASSSLDDAYARELYCYARLYRYCALRYERVADSSWRAALVPRSVLEEYASYLFLCTAPCVLID